MARVHPVKKGFIVGAYRLSVAECIEFRRIIGIICDTGSRYGKRHRLPFPILPPDNEPRGVFMHKRLPV